MEFWDSKISGKKKLAVDNKILALDDSGSSYFQCIFQIAPHIFNLKQKDEDRFSLSIDHYKFKALMKEEAKGNLKRLIEDSMKSPLDDVDKLLKQQLEKEKEEKEEKERNKNLLKEISSSKKKEKDLDNIISIKDIKEIKNNLNNNKNNINNNNNKNDKDNQVFEQNKNILKNVSIFSEKPKPQNVEDFKRSSNMFGIDFFTGEHEKENDKNKNNNPFNINNNKINDNNEINNMKNAQNPHNQEVLNQLMNKIVPENLENLDNKENKEINKNNNKKNNNKELEKLFDEFNGSDSDYENNSEEEKGDNNIKLNNNKFNSNFNNNINNSNNNNMSIEDKNTELFMIQISTLKDEIKKLKDKINNDKKEKELQIKSLELSRSYFIKIFDNVDLKGEKIQMIGPIMKDLFFNDNEITNFIKSKSSSAKKSSFLGNLFKYKI